MPWPLHIYGRSSAGGAPAPRRPAARALPLAGTRGGSLHGVAAPLQTRGVRAVVVGLLLAGLRLLLRHRGLILPVLLVAPHGAEHRAGPGADRGALPRVAADRAADRAHPGAARGPADRAAARRRRRRRGLGGRRVIAALLQRPAVTLGLVLLLLLLALTFLWIRVDLLAARRARQEATDEDAGRRRDMHTRSQLLGHHDSLVSGRDRKSTRLNSSHLGI